MLRRIILSLVDNSAAESDAKYLQTETCSSLNS